MLCVWAYVGQVRVDELMANFGDMVSVTWHFVDVFGDTESKVKPGYGEFVREVVARFDHVEVHPAIWENDIPASSAGCHLFLRAAALLGDDDAFRKLTAAMRDAFFREAANVSERSVQNRLAEAAGLDAGAIAAVIDNGRAHAALQQDRRLAQDLQVRMSPSLVFNEGRQRLYGNVGYRVIEANIRELLHNPPDEASWC